jgi:hypothetical protein
MANIIEFFKNLISKDLLLLEKILIIVSLIGALYGFVRFVGKLVKGIFNLFNGKNLYHHLKPYFSKNEIRRALESYIHTYSQKEDPSKEKEPAHSKDRQNLIPFFIKTVFREKKELRRFSEVIARNMYEYQQAGAGYI